MSAPVPERERRTRLLYVSPLRALAVDVEKNLRAPLRGIALAAQRLGHEVHEPTVGSRTGDTPADERRRLVRHPPDVLITTPESLYLMLTSQARDTLRDVEAVIIDEIHALAATKRGAHLAVTLERLEARCERPPQRIGLSATQRPLEEIARFLGGFGPDRSPRPVTVVDAGMRKALEIEVVVPVEDMGQLGVVIEEPVSGPAAAGPVRRSIWPAMHPRLLELVQQHRSTIIFVNARRLAERLATRLNELAAEQAGDEPSAYTGSESMGRPPHPGHAAESARRSSGADESRIGEAGGGGAGTSVAAESARRSSGADESRIGEAGGGGAGAGVTESAWRSSGADESRIGEAGGGRAGTLVMAHHGSLSKERRLLIEDDLKSGRLKGLVATSSLELGIDMGAVDLVVQVESPGAVARGLQRIGRAGHQVGAPSRGKLFPKHRADLVEAAVVVDRMHRGLIEHTRYPRTPLDVLAQQIVAMCALDDWTVEDLAALVRRAANFEGITDEVLTSVLDLLAGRYPSDEFAELRPRIVWDRVGGVVRARAGAQRLAVTSGGTIPDRGLFGVFLPDGTRVGELDEEMVYESRVGETFLLGASTWRIEDITHERVVVVPAPGQPGKMPFWHGDGPGRPLELGRAVGEFVRTIRALAPADALARLEADHDLDPSAARNLLGYLDEQATSGGAVPDDRTIVVERFRDEIGDWRVCVLSPFGAQVHAPWAMALSARLADRWGLEVELMWSDDGIVLRLPEAVDELPLDELMIDPDEIDEIVISRLPSTAMFASRFRECAARALLLPRRRPDRRTPLWQQRQKAADLLSVAGKYPTFPILLEATRECVNDVFDLPALREVLRDLRSRKVRMVAVDTPRASPFAQSLLFGWIAVYMYKGDAPLAERRAAALALDRDLLRELLGAEELRELIDPLVLDELELELQRLPENRRARDADEVADLLRLLGPLTMPELSARSAAPDTTVAGWVDSLVAERRAIKVAVAGEERVAAAEDAARLRDALGCALPLGLPTAFTDPVDRPLVDLVARHARTSGPFVTGQVAARLGLQADRAREALEVLEAEGRVVRGEFRPDGVEREWCDDDVLRQLRRRSLAALRREVEPVEPTVLGRFLPQWQGVGVPRRGLDGLVEVLGILQGAPLVASVLEADVLPARMTAYRPADLDALCTAGEVVWVGAGSLGASDGRIRLLFRDQVGLLLPTEGDGPTGDGELHDALRGHLAERGASFWPELVRAVAAAGLAYDDASVLDALWDLVWAGEVTNDSLAPLRARVAGRPRRAGPGPGRSRPGRPRLERLTRLGPPAGAGRWSLVASFREPVTPTEASHARALQLLERYGVLTREAALGEGTEGGFAGVYPVLKALEDQGRVRRGYFVAGLGAAQFALPGAVDRLRAARTGDHGDEPAHPLVLAATDPASPYGAALPWPDGPAGAGRPGRSAGAHVVLADGALLAYLERGGRSLLTFPAAADHPGWVECLVGLVKDGRYRSLEITKVDGAAVREAPLAADLRAAGFAEGYRGLVHRARAGLGRSGP